MRPSIHRIGLALVLTATACVSPDADHLSAFVEDAPITGRVLENVTACTVDAECYLRIEFADTSITALYAAGERPRPQCAIPSGIPEVAFAVDADALVDVVVAPCESGQRYLRSIRGR